MRVVIESELRTARVAQHHQRVHRNTGGVGIKLRNKKLAGLEFDAVAIHIAAALQFAVDDSRQHVHRLRREHLVVGLFFRYVGRFAHKKHARRRGAVAVKKTHEMRPGHNAFCDGDFEKSFFLRVSHNGYAGIISPGFQRPLKLAADLRDRLAAALSADGKKPIYLRRRGGCRE